jgi:hypothetical protein
LKKQANVSLFTKGIFIEDITLSFRKGNNAAGNLILNKIIEGKMKF